MRETDKHVIGWCETQDGDTWRIYRFWDDGTITCASSDGAVAWGDEPVQEVTGQVVRWEGMVPDEVRRDGAEA